MAKLGEKYESIVIFSMKKTEEEIKALVEKFTDIISADATLVSVDEWGKKRLAYEIDYQTEGYYVLYKFDSQPSFPAELNRVYNITDGILRSLITLRVDGK
ncbi:MAG: 30S ribosomal protein S6 [Oscillospiraceae bacterium]|nr:30S ribosomal protein S6 [Oscillospiraceae bacterium]